MDETSLSFFVPGKPQGKARARTVNIKGMTRSFTPENTVIYENLIRSVFLQSHGKASMLIPDKEPVGIYINAYFAIPKSTSKKKAELMRKDIILPTKKPDADNIGKIVADALNGIAYHDDSQVVDLHVVKRYSTVSEGLMILISKVDMSEGNTV